MAFMKRELYLCSDEIHCDLILENELRHLPPASLDERVLNKGITLMAPSKTFNIAGFGVHLPSSLNRLLRARFKKAMRGIVRILLQWDSCLPMLHIAEGNSNLNLQIT